MRPVTFEGGLPYGPDVRILREQIPVDSLTEGRIVTHEQIEKAIKVSRKASRYYGVVNSWINAMKNESRIFMVWEPKIGLKVLAPAELLLHAEKRTRQKIRQTGKAIKIFTWIDRDRLDGVGQKRLDNQIRVVDAVRSSLDAARKELAIELAPIKSLPRRSASQ